MNKKKRFTSIICTAALLSSMCTAGMIPASADTTNVTTFTFTDSGITVSNEKDSNYKIEGTALTINGKGSYKVTGSCSDGSVKVKKSTTGVTLTLSDLTLTSTTTAPLMCNKNSQADIIIDGTVTLEDNVQNSEDYWTDQGYTDSDSEVDAAENAVVKLKGASKVTMSGDGTLNIKANAKNGIKSGATLDSDLETELAVDSSSEYYAYLTMSGLNVNIDTTNVYTPASSSSSTSGSNQNFGQGGQEAETYGDGINAESCLNIRSGSYTINAGDDGIHSDYILNIGEMGASNDNLKIDIQQSYEGIEGATINFYSGDIDIAASDDAVNAANGDLSNYNFAMNIYGGDIYADATNGSDNDGLDSNGDLTIYGGKVVSLSDSGGNAFDLDGSFNLYGGTILGLGAAPMGNESPSSSSTQSWAVWSGSGSSQGGNQGGSFGGNQGGNQGGGPGGNSGGNQGGGSQGSSSTNISSSDQSKVTLTVGSTSYSVGSSLSSISANSKVAVMLNGSTELISTTAKTSASYVTFAGDINSSNTSTLTYNSNNSSGKTSSVNSSTGETVTVSGNTFSYDGYTFVEWNTSADGAGTSYSAGDSFILSSDATLYAIWKSNSEEEENNLTAAFDYDSGVKNITVYNTQDYTANGTVTNTANVRDGDTGEIDNSGSGQVNFKVNLNNGYKIDSISITEGAYKNLKDVSTTDSPNTYRITKITDNIDIYITTVKDSSDTDSDSDTDTDTRTYPELSSGGFVFDNSTSKWSTVNAYVYDDSGSSIVSNAQWPGLQMTDCGNDYWKYELDSKFTSDNIKVIFNNGSDQIPTAMQSGFQMKSTDKKVFEDGSWNDLPQAEELINNSTVSATEVTVGTTVKIKGAAEGGTAPYTYAFYYKRGDASNWTLKGTEYGTATSTTLCPAYADTYTVKVNVKDSSGNVASKTFTITSSKSDELTNNSSVSATNVTVGTTVTIKGAATGGTAPYTYAFYYKRGDASNWTLKGTEYGTATSTTLCPAYADTYTVKVNVKDSSGNVASKTFTITSSKAESLTNNASVSATNVTVGTTVTIKGAATGGTAPYTYAFYYKRGDASDWTLKGTEYGTASTATLCPAYADTYTVKVNVKDSSGNVASKTFTITSNEALVNNSTVSATEVNVGTTIKIKGAASGGTSPYTYAFYYKRGNASSWTLKGTEYGTASSTTLCPAYADTYTVMVKVKDSSGQVVSKTFTITSKNAS